MKKLILLALLIFGAIFAYYYYVGNVFNKNYKIPLFDKGQTMVLASTAFSNGDLIPLKYSCDGKDVNPPLNFSNVPVEAKTLALTVEDIDSKGGFTHWIIFNLPPQSNGIPEKTVVETSIEGAVEGLNDFGTKGYAGPCPTIGEHHYVFTLYALSDFVTLPEGITKNQLLAKMQNITIKQTALTGRYKKQ